MVRLFGGVLMPSGTELIFDPGPDRKEEVTLQIFDAEQRCPIPRLGQRAIELLRLFTGWALYGLGSLRAPRVARR